jgi:hypothetical protein
MLMDSNRIEELLRKYYDCETSLEEEQQLRTYFRDQKFPEHMKETASLFRYFEQNKKKTLTDASFDAAVMAKIKGAPRGRMASLMFNAMKIAAGLSVLVVAFLIVKNEVRKSTPQEIVDTYEDPKLAFEETKKALMLISKNFGTAEENAKKINLLNEAKDEIAKKPEKEKNL